MLSLILQLWLASLSLAAPVGTTAWDTSKSYGTTGGIVGFIVLVVDILVWSKPLPPL